VTHSRQFTHNVVTCAVVQWFLLGFRGTYRFLECQPLQLVASKKI